jgi:hypothetical protein
MAPNRVTSLGDGIQTIADQDVIMVGQPFRAYYGYKNIGIFQSKEEISASPKQFNSNKVAPGDLKYADLSGPNGKPDGKVDAYDREVIGNPYPEWLIGFNANAAFKGFDVGFSLQGVQNVDRFIRNSSTLGFFDDNTNILSYWADRWTPENPSTSLYRIGASEAGNAQFSSYQILDASYIRLKNIELGYTFQSSLLSSLKISKFRIYVAGQNLITFTKMKNFDPESNRDNYTANNVPLYKVFTIGGNIVF